MTHPETPVAAMMTRQPIALSPADSVEDALALLERYPFRHLPVEDMNVLVGIVSDRDLAFAGALPRGKRGPGRGARRPLKIEELMRREVRTVSPSTSARAAVELLLEHRIGALPVVTDSDCLEGIVTETDFLRLFERCACWPEGGTPAEVSVEAHMSRPVLTAYPEQDLLEAAEKLLSSHVRHLPVVDGGQLVGMLSDRDLRRGLARLAHEDRALEEQSSAGLARLAVEQVMSRPCLSIPRQSSLRSAAYTLLECRIGALPVVEHEHVIGILSQRDLLEHYRDWSSFGA